MTKHKYAQTPMKFLVWYNTIRGPAPQLWAEDFTVTTKSTIMIIQKIELKEDEWYTPLGVLLDAYPCPKPKTENENGG